LSNFRYFYFSIPIILDQNETLLLRKKYELFTPGIDAHEPNYAEPADAAPELTGPVPANGENRNRIPEATGVEELLQDNNINTSIKKESPFSRTLRSLKESEDNAAIGRGGFLLDDGVGKKQLWDASKESVSC